MGNIAGSTLLLYVQGVIIAGLFVFALHQIDQTFVRSWRFLLQVADWPKRARGRKMIRRARKIGPQLIWNSENRTIGVTSASLFQKELEKLLYTCRWVREVKLSELKELGKERLEGWRKVATKEVRIFLPMTYCFAEDSGVQTFGHAGRVDDLNVLKIKIVEMLTGVKPSQVYEKDFKTALNILVVKDPRLSVPLANGGKCLTDEELVMATHLEASSMLDYLFPSLLRPKY